MSLFRYVNIKWLTPLPKASGGGVGVVGTIAVVIFFAVEPATGGVVNPLGFARTFGIGGSHCNHSSLRIEGVVDRICLTASLRDAIAAQVIGHGGGCGIGQLGRRDTAHDIISINGDEGTFNGNRKNP